MNRKLKHFIENSLAFRLCSRVVGVYKFVNQQGYDCTDVRRLAQHGIDARIQQNCEIVPQNLYMEDHTRLSIMTNMISSKGKVIIKKYTAIGSNCTIVPGSHVPTVGVPQYLSYLHVNDKDGEIVFGEDVWVGTGCIFLQHCNIGRGAVIGAGSIVTKEVPPYAVVVGSPARIIATKFTIEQIITHETILYPQEERMTKDELIELFDRYYQGMKAIGTSHICEEDLERVRKEKLKRGIVDYSQNDL